MDGLHVHQITDLLDSLVQDTRALLDKLFVVLDLDSAPVTAD